MRRPVRVFVVGTGRSGTMTLADLLSSVQGVTVEHEHEPKLLAEIKGYAEGRLEHERMVELLRSSRAPAQIGGDLVSGESHNQLSFVLPALAEAFPDARIVWLIRDGRAVVASLVGRNIYHPREFELRTPGTEEWALTRINGDAAGDVSGERWRDLDTFGRCCWYWGYTHRTIGRELRRLPLESFRVRLEDLPELWSDLRDFCTLPASAVPAVPHANRSARAPMSWQHWSRAQQSVFRELCGTVMDEHYPGWAREQRRGIGEDVLSWTVRAKTTLRSSAPRWSRLLRSRLGPAGRRALQSQR
jgi:hypothetical protein